MEKRIILVIISLSVVIIIIVMFVFNSKEIKQVCFSGKCFDVEIARTSKERARGLMFRESLLMNQGMLFIFEIEKNPSFWLKNVLIPLDIIWLNSEKEIVFISKNNQPCLSGDCPKIQPPIKVKYALEINAGIAEKLGIKIGDEAEFTSP